MKKSRLRLLATASMLVLAGCGTMKDWSGSLPWIKPAPGDTPDQGRAKRDGAQTGTDPAALTARTTPPPAAGARRTDSAAAGVAMASPATAPATSRAGDPATGPKDAPPTASGYPQASRYGDLLFVSGQIPIDMRTKEITADGSIEEQTRLVLENLRTVLESNRLTMANVVSTTVYLKNINDLRGMDVIYERFFKGVLPSRSVVEVSRLPRGALLEISAVAGR